VLQKLALVVVLSRGQIGIERENPKVVPEHMSEKPKKLLLRTVFVVVFVLNLFLALKTGNNRKDVTASFFLGLVIINTKLRSRVLPRHDWAIISFLFVENKTFSKIFQTLVLSK
jgi:hypothetical protein